MMNLMDHAAHCPVCERQPVRTDEMGFKAMLVFLRCPLGHPYVCCGDTLIGAIDNWNHYIELRIQADTAKMIAGISWKMENSYCRACEAYTKSIMHFKTINTSGMNSGYHVVTQECARCKLIKSEKEAA